MSNDALFEVVRSINLDSQTDFIYSDEDNITEDGLTRYNPFFKPDWSPDTLRSYNYICHFTVLKKELFTKSGGFREGFNGSQDYDLFLRATECAQKIVHIPKILYHWRASKNSVVLNPESKKYAYVSAIKAIEEHLNRLGLRGVVKQSHFIGLYKIIYSLIEEPLVSIIISNKDSFQDLKKCIESIFSESTYRNFEIIIATHDSTSKKAIKYYDELKKYPNVKIVKWDGELNYSAINNFAFQYANGKYTVFMHNDIKIITKSWLEEMIGYMQREDVGVVGAKLYYSNNTIEHAGIIIGINGSTGHSHRNFYRNDMGYFAKLSTIQNFSAVTSACLMVKSSLFKNIGGFNEHLKFELYDVDLCLRIRENDKLIIFTPFVEMFHCQSTSPKYSKTQAYQIGLRGDLTFFSESWKEILKNGDPYYNKNLTLLREDFSLRLNS